MRKWHYPGIIIIIIIISICLSVQDDNTSVDEFNATGRSNWQLTETNRMELQPLRLLPDTESRQFVQTVFSLL